MTRPVNTSWKTTSLPSGALLVAGGVFSLTLVSFLRAPLLPTIGRELQFDAFGVSAVVAAFGLGRVLVDLPAGGATDRYSARGMLSAAGGAVAVGAVLMAVAQHLAVLFSGAILMGAGSAWAAAAAVAFFASAPRSSRGTSVSFYGAALLTAQSIGPLIAGYAALVFSWRAVMVGGAVISMLSAGFFQQVRKTGESASGQSGRTSGEATVVPAVVLGLVYALPAVQFGIGAAVLQAMVPLIGEEDFQFSSGTVGLALGIGGGLRLVAALVAGWGSDRFGRKTMLLPSLGLQTLGLIAFALDFGAAGWWITILLLTLGSVAANLGGTIIADLSEGGPLGKRLGRFRLVGDVSMMLAPLMTGWLFSRYGLQAAVLPLLLLAAGITTGAMRIPETR